MPIYSVTYDSAPPGESFELGKVAINDRADLEAYILGLNEFAKLFKGELDSNWVRYDQALQEGAAVGIWDGDVDQGGEVIGMGIFRFKRLD